MSWRYKTVIRILMFVAKMIAEEEGLRKDLQDLANHISTELHL